MNKKAMTKLIVYVTAVAVGHAIHKGVRRTLFDKMKEG